MALLFLVTESDRDALFYKMCAEALGGMEVSWHSPLRNRKGDGSAAVKAQLKYALRQAKQAASGVELVGFIAAIDNDRSPHEENNAQLDRTKLSKLERNRESRQHWIDDVHSEVLGHDPSQIRLKTASAVPVEMIEAWTVKATSTTTGGGPMPHFSWQCQQRAAAYYHPSKPPPQWKDLELLARKQLGKPDDEDFYTHVVDVIAADPEDLASRSLSFRLFWEQLKTWRPTADS
jgi:hypothetical protein